MTPTEIRKAAGRIIPQKGERLVPVLSGLLLALSFPPFTLPVLPFVALVPLLLFIADRPDGAEGRWSAARAGFLTGLVYFGLTLYWLIVALIFYSALAIPAYVLSVLVLAGFATAFAVALHYVGARTPVPAALSAAVLWTAMEWLQGHLGDLSFPWLGLGSALSSVPSAAGAADLVGTRGLTFWLVLVNGIVAATILRVRAGRRFGRLAAVGAVVLLLPLAYGIWRTQQIEMRPAARVAVVQPNIPEDLKMDRARAVDSSMAALKNLTLSIPPGSVDLVAWPEVAVPAVLENPYAEGLEETVRSLSARIDAPIVVGAYGMEGTRGDRTYFNSAFLVDDEGIAGDAYHKQYLVPFVERIPFVDPDRLEQFIGDLQYFGGLGRGRSADPVEAGGARFGVLICYESIFAPLSRTYTRRGADFLVNITNDAWYGREPWYSRTTALWQHPAHLAMRAIEMRTGIARAANTGISMFVDPRGRMYEKTALFEPDVRIATVYTTDEETLYARWGDWLATGAAAAAVLLIIAARIGRRPRPRIDPAPRQSA